MSGSRGGASNFGVRLSLDGAEAVEGGLRRIQASAVQVGAEIGRAGDSTGRALAVIERGTQAASQGLTKMGGDFAALAPVVDGAGGAIGRVVTELGSGAGLLGVLGAAGAAVAAAVSLYQNWDTVTRALGGTVDFLTGRVRESTTAITASNAALREFIRLGQDATTAANQRFIQGQLQQASEAEGRLPAARGALQSAERALEEARSGLSGERRAAIVSGAGAVPGGQARQTPEGAAARQALLDRIAERRQNDPAVQQRIREAEEAVFQAQARVRQEELLRDAARGNVAAAASEGRGPAPGVRDVPKTPATAPRGGGGGRAAAAPSNDGLLRERDNFAARFDPAERYRQTLEGIANLNDRLAAAGQSPLPDEAVVRATEQAMQDYQRATEGAARSTADLATNSKDWERAAQGAAKALAGAFEDLVFEGKSFDDVLKNLERSLLRIGNQYLLNPLFQQGFDALLGGGRGAGGGQAGSAINGGGIAGAFGSLLGSFGGAAGGAKGAIDAVGLVTAAAPLVLHDGGVVGAGGLPTRMVPLSLFANAPRFHAGGMIGPDERPIIAQTGERVLSRKEAAAYGRGGGITVNISTPDAASFRNSEGQIMSRMAAALARSGRNR